MSADALETSDRPTVVPPRDRVLGRLLERQAERHGDHMLLRMGDTSWTFRGAAAIAARRAGALVEAGIGPGDRVVIFCQNRSEVLEVFVGCAWLGAVAVPLNAAARGAQLRHMLVDCGAKLLVTEARLLDAVRQCGDGLPLKAIWLVGDGDGEATSGVSPQSMPAVRNPVDRAAAGPGDLLTILYTSGTTGPSKGVCCPHAHVYWWGESSAELLGVTADDVLLTTLPLFHVNALNSFYQALLRGATLVVEPRFSASGFSNSLVRHNATVTYLLGAMVPILLATPPQLQDRAHKVRVALAPAVPEAFLKPFRDRFGIATIDGYGSTETNFVIGNPVDRQVPGAMGHIRKGFVARVVDEDDNPVPDGIPGELLLRAEEPFAFASGYFNLPEKTLESWRNLWFHTGDRVVRDDTGLYRFVDRIKDVIRRRGENISAFEVEEALSSHPAVAAAAVFPVPSDLAEDEVMAVLVPAPGMTPAPEELLDFCRSRLSYFALPRFIEFAAELPLTENGKVQKFKLRERGVTATTWDRETSGYQLRRD
ncbi:MAG: AMP-binding protein [Rhizobiaceae bacterium]|nr:AMP-binding protein [Rhizobiaceae bacterium]